MHVEEEQLIENNRDLISDAPQRYYPPVSSCMSR